MYLHDDIIDRNVNQFDEEPNEAHYAEADGGGYCDLLKFCAETGRTKSITDGSNFRKQLQRARCALCIRYLCGRAWYTS